MKAVDIMTGPVVTVRPGMKVHDVAATMVEHRVSALPVVAEDDALIGIVTESDLLHRRETGTETKRSWWLDLFSDADKRAREFVKAHGLAVEDVMTRVVVTVPEDAPVAEVADILDAHRIRRVPVLRDGRVVGIVSRTDLVRALATQRRTESPARIDNGALHKRVYDAIRGTPWLNTLYMNYSVSDGVVTLVGFVESADQKRAIKVLVEEVDGVTAVDDKLRFKTWQTTV